MNNRLSMLLFQKPQRLLIQEIDYTFKLFDDKINDMPIIYLELSMINYFVIVTSNFFNTNSDDTIVDNKQIKNKIQLI